MQDYRKDDPVVDVAPLSFEPELVHVPAGPFLMGLTDEQIEYMRGRYEWPRRRFFESEQPACTVSLPAFNIGRYPVTNAEYQVFVLSAGYRCPHYGREPCFREEEATGPVVEVTWNDARAYAEWLRSQLGVPESAGTIRYSGEQPMVRYQIDLGSGGNWTVEMEGRVINAQATVMEQVLRALATGAYDGAAELLKEGIQQGTVWVTEEPAQP
jgi:hypothetical protein